MPFIGIADADRRRTEVWRTDVGRIISEGIDECLNDCPEGSGEIGAMAAAVRAVWGAPEWD
jgi:hypothetical protein